MVIFPSHTLESLDLSCSRQRAGLRSRRSLSRSGEQDKSRTSVAVTGFSMEGVSVVLEFRAQN